VLLDRETLDFIPLANLNPVDYTMRSVLQNRVNRTKILDVDESKRRINSEWAALSHTIGECAVGEWLQHLPDCVRAGGGHFEHTL